MEEVSSNTCSSRPMLERKTRPQEQLNCQRCNSINTKFCYYNNYSLTQPRYFCKTCRRYWTEGGSLRNVPVGGGSRKNKRSSSSVSSSTAAASNISKLLDLNPPSISQFSSQNPKIHTGQDLNLSFPAAIQESQGTSHLLEMAKTGNSSRGLNSFIPTLIPDSNTLYSSGFTVQDFKPSLNFAAEEFGVGNRHGFEENGGRILFPLGELKNLSSTIHYLEVDQNKGQGTISSTATTSTGSNGFWNGMLSGGGGSW